MFLLFLPSHIDPETRVGSFKARDPGLGCRSHTFELGSQEPHLEVPSNHIPK